MTVVGKSLRSQWAYDEKIIEISPHINVTACPLNKIHLEVVYQPTPFHQMEQAGQQLILLSKWGRKKYCQKSQITTRINSLTKTSQDTLTLTAITSFLSFLYSFTSGKISTLFIFYTCFSLNCEEGVGGRGDRGIQTTYLLYLVFYWLPLFSPPLIAKY